MTTLWVYLPNCEQSPSVPEQEGLTSESGLPIRLAQAVDSRAWLHKSCKPLETVDFTEDPSLFDPGDYCSSGVCFV